MLTFQVSSNIYNGLNCFWIKRRGFSESPSFVSEAARGYSPMTVRPRVEACPLNVVWVVDPEGTYMVLVVPAFLVTKEEQFDTSSEHI